VRNSSAAVLALAAAGCGPLPQLGGETPPLILTTAAAADLADARGRFREILCAVDTARGYYRDRPCGSLLHRLDNEPAPGGGPVTLGVSPITLRIRIVPGIFGQCAEDRATPFLDAVEPRPGTGYDLGQFGFDVAALRVSGRGSSGQNAAQSGEQLRAEFTHRPLAPSERLVLIGHSKGMSDLIEFIARERSDSDGEQMASPLPEGSSIVSLSGVVAGTPIADMGEDIYGPLRHVSVPGCAADDGGGVTSLTRRERLKFMAQHPLPTDLHFYSVAAFTRPANISAALRPTYNALARTDARNDGNVIFTDSIIPHSTVLGYLNADHWAVAMPFEIYAPTFARTVATRNHYPRVVLLEAIARMIAEDYQGRLAQDNIAGDSTANVSHMVR
jgi:hypothetical protein